MNARQGLVLLVSVVTVALVFLCPPFWNDGGLIGGTEYRWQRDPVAALLDLDYNWGLVRWELSFVAICALIALIACRRNATAPQVAVWCGGTFIEGLILVWQIPQFNVILTPEVTWLALNLVGLLLLGTVVMLGRRRPRTNAPQLRER